MDSRNDEIQLARRTAMYYSKFDPQGTGVLKPDQLYQLLLEQRRLNEENEEEAPKLLEGEVEYFYSLFEMGQKHDISQGLPLTQFEDKARLAEFDGCMEDWRLLQERIKNRPSLHAMRSGDASRFCGCFSQQRTHAFEEHAYA